MRMRDRSREKLIEEINGYRRQLGKTESEKRRNDLQKCISKLKRQLIEYDAIRNGGKGHVFQKRT